jgi:hypothetical protein
MLDNELKILLSEQLDLAVANAGWDFLVVQKDQPHQEGVPDKGTIFFEHLFDVPYGFAKTKLVYDEDIQQFVEVEQQWTRSTFQISALKQENPMDVTAPTASDIANRIRLHMNSRFVAREFIRKNVGLERATEVRNPYFEDDKIRFEAHPSFDVVLTHIKTLDNVIDRIMRVDADVHVVD